MIGNDFTNMTVAEAMRRYIDINERDPFELEVYFGILSMRESEIGGLIFSDVNFDESYLEICRTKLLNKDRDYVVVNFTKTDDSARRVYLPSYVLKLIKEIRVYRTILFQI